MKWENIEGMEHAKFKDVNGVNRTVRISQSFYPLSYGTTSYMNLDLLTDLGWKSLWAIICKQAGEKEYLVSLDAAVQRAKDYAEELYRF